MSFASSSPAQASGTSASTILVASRALARRRLISISSEPETSSVNAVEIVAVNTAATVAEP